jgi:hypothetical protein
MRCKWYIDDGQQNRGEGVDLIFERAGQTKETHKKKRWKTKSRDIEPK